MIFHLQNGELTFTPDETTTLTPTSMNITYTIKGNNRYEFHGHKRFGINLGTPTNAEILTGKGRGFVYYYDDDLPTLKIRDANKNEGTAK